LNYEYERYTSLFKSLKLPILTGIDVHGNIFTYDMVDNPHLLIAGETGSGKSTQVRSVLTSIIQTLSPERIELYLCDLKRSEFFLFKNIEHVKGVYHSAREMLPMLQYLQLEMQKRGNQLNQHERSHVDDLPDPPPYILLCIDEVALLQDEKEIMKLVEEISAIERALGVFLILSMQRSDSKILDGKLKNNLTVRMGFKCADLINSRIIGTPGSEKLTVKGRMLLKLPIYSKLIEIQAPYLSVESAKKILESISLTNRKNQIKSI
jgi:S-DNA-T family DNA segregation ATPase FtsK/SpoIIIE